MKSSITLLGRLATVLKMFSEGVMTLVLHNFSGLRGLASFGGERGGVLEVGGLVLGKARCTV